MSEIDKDRSRKFEREKRREGRRLSLRMDGARRGGRARESKESLEFNKLAYIKISQ
jgi:hypothetical protein